MPGCGAFGHSGVRANLNGKEAVELPHPTRHASVESRIMLERGYTPEYRRRLRGGRVPHMWAGRGRIMNDISIGAQRKARQRARVLVPVFLVSLLFGFSAWGADAARPAEVAAPIDAVQPAKDAAAADGLAGMGIGGLVAMVTAIGALGMAAFSLVDATKSFWGGPSNIGYGNLEATMSRFTAALDRALGQDAKGNGEWRRAVRAHWINGRPRGEQKAIVKSLIRLGLTTETARAVAEAGHVKADTLAVVATKLEGGQSLEEVDLNVIGRLDASIDAQLDAAFDRADQLYRNWSRLFAGVASVGLAFVAKTSASRRTSARRPRGRSSCVPVGPDAARRTART